jgi:hypothetical protein
MSIFIGEQQGYLLGSNVLALALLQTSASSAHLYVRNCRLFCLCWLLLLLLPPQ